MKKTQSIVLNEKGNVLYLNMNLWYGVKVGGSVGHIAGVINELSKRDYKVIYSSISDSPVIDSSVKRLLLNSPDSFGIPPEINSYRFEKFNTKIIDEATIESNPSFIYQRLSISSYLGIKLAVKYSIPLIVEYNGSEVWIARHWGRSLTFEHVAIKAEQVMLKKADIVVTISEVLKDELISRGVEAKKIICYPNCIDPTVFNSERFSLNEKNTLRTFYSLSPDIKIISFLGTFGQWHGVEILAKSIVQLVKNNKLWLLEHKIKFMLIGDGLKMPIVKEIIENGNANEFCIFTGLIEQKMAPLYLAISDILISPHVNNSDGSKFFGSPTKLFEYLAMGKPIIASDLDQIGDVLKNSIRINSGETDELAYENKRVSYLVSPGNIDELSSAIFDLVSRPNLQKTLLANARSLALEKFTWKIHVDKILGSNY
jgi:glycosyltransferase involved in cell wall biosynthesis